MEDFLDITYLDQRGSGRSPDSGDYHLDRLAEDIEELRLSLGKPRICLIAHSFGGLIANAYARKYRERVSALLMINITLHFLGPSTLRMQIAEMDRRMGQPQRILEGKSQLELRELRDAVRDQFNRTERPFSLYTSRAETVQAMTAIDNGYKRYRGFGKAVMEVPTAYVEYFDNQTDSTSEVVAPVLIVAGSSDFLVGPRHHEAFRYPHMTVEVIECGHFPFFDCPGEFIEAVGRFARTALESLAPMSGRETLSIEAAR
jgi:proline iminopeptidase